GNLGLLSKSEQQDSNNTADSKKEQIVPEKRNPFTLTDYILMGIVGVLGVIYAFNDPLSKHGVIDVFAFLDTPFLRGQSIMILLALVLFLYLVVSRIKRYDKVVRDRMFGVILLAFFLIFFFMSFEQGATSLVLVARDYIDRELTGSGLMMFNVVNTLL